MSQFRSFVGDYHTPMLNSYTNDKDLNSVNLEVLVIWVMFIFVMIWISNTIFCNLLIANQGVVYGNQLEMIEQDTNMGNIYFNMRAMVAKTCALKIFGSQTTIIDLFGFQIAERTGKPDGDDTCFQ